MRSLKAKGDQLSEPEYQLDILHKAQEEKQFGEKLDTIGMYPLRPQAMQIFQVNIGKMCNQTCEHCHVDAGPDRKEIMDKQTMEACIRVVRECPSIHTIDITGGAPEMHPDFLWFIEQLSACSRKIIVRSNLTILVSNKKYKDYPAFFKKHAITIIASLPCYTAENTDKQRGSGVFADSLTVLKQLNNLGYGVENTGLELHLVYNPLGAYLPGSQESLEQDYKRVLQENYGVVFNKLYTITNMPISRFLSFLLLSGKYETYMQTLIDAFNPSAVQGLMCRNTLSVGWDGRLYDCDFNQMLELSVASPVRHIQDFDPLLLEQRLIVTDQHCYGCTAGAGSSCQGTIA